MRVHLVAGLWVGLLGAAVPLGVAERIALVLCVFLVLSAEVANSALEALVDLVTRERDERARIAKDAGAGAVLILAACSVAVLAVVLLHAAPVLRAAWPTLWRHALLGAGISVAMAGLLTEWRRARIVDHLLSLAGAVLLVPASLHTRSAIFTCLAVLVFVVAVAVAGARRRAR
jgi:diacylglycerol kinase (ATP)